MKPEELTRKALDIIFSCKTEEFKYINVNWIANELGVSAPYLSRVFKKETGESLIESLVGEKCFRGYLLLLYDKNLTIEEVAAALDYTPSHFIQVFKKYFWESPARFRRQVGDSKASPGFRKKLMAWLNIKSFFLPG